MAQRQTPPRASEFRDRPDGKQPMQEHPFQMQTSPSRPHTPNASSSRLSHPTPSHPITPQPGARHLGAAPIAQSLWKLFGPLNPKPSCPASPSYRHHSKGSCPPRPAPGPLPSDQAGASPCTRYGNACALSLEICEYSKPPCWWQLSPDLNI